MSKYSKEFIIKTCEEYLSCNSSKLELCNKYGIHYKNGKSIIDDWIPRYLEDGADAFLSTVGNKVYLSSDKISTVEDYIGEKGSLRTIAAKYGISSKETLMYEIIDEESLRFAIKDYIRFYREERSQERFNNKTPLEIRTEAMASEVPAKYPIPENKRIKK